MFHHVNIYERMLKSFQPNPLLKIWSQPIISIFFGKLVSHRTIKITKEALKPINFKGIAFNESLSRFTLLTKPQILK